jgi:hypothetical protein
MQIYITFFSHMQALTTQLWPKVTSYFGVPQGKVLLVSELYQDKEGLNLVRPSVHCERKMTLMTTMIMMIMTS